MSTGRYAVNTEVAPDRSRAEIERTLIRFGADQFAYGWEADGALVAFRLHGRHVRIRVPLPRRDDPAFTTYIQHGTRYRRTDTARDKLYDQAVRQKWRALALVVKAKLEAVDSGISTFESEFLSQILLPSGGTVGDWITPQITLAYENGQMPKLLPGIGETSR